MMKYRFFITIFLLTLFSCKNSSQKQGQVEQSTEISSDSLNVQENKQEPMKVTSRFLSLVQHIDSSGYIFDTIRYTPFSEQHTNIVVEQYIFFEIPKETTIPFHNIVHKGEHPFAEAIKDFNIKPFGKAIRVTSYYFRKKEPDIIGGEKWYTDGIIEEWTFDNIENAQKATQELINTELTALYANTGAHVCCTDNYMYIFHSRGIKFMVTQEKFFNWFINQNNVKIHN